MTSEMSDVMERQCLQPLRELGLSFEDNDLDDQEKRDATIMWYLQCWYDFREGVATVIL